MSSENPQPAETKSAQRQADVYDVLAWLEVNKMKVAVIALILVVIGFAVATMRYLREQKETQASSELLALKASLTPSTNTPPVPASAFAKVAQEFSGTAAADRARILAATTLFTEGKYADAETAFKAYLSEFPNGEWRPTAAYGVATAQEAQNKPEAAQSYQAVTTGYAKSAVADDAHLALARIAEAKNQPAEALRIYNQLLTPATGAQPGEAPNRSAMERKEALLRAHPELQTNAVPTAGSTMAPGANSPGGLPSLTVPGGATGAVPTLQVPTVPSGSATTSGN
jgi:TolA-binding protein